MQKRLVVLFAVLSLAVTAPHAAFSQTVFQVLLDLDNDPSTGCAIPTSDGEFGGVDGVLSTELDGGLAAVGPVRFEGCAGGVFSDPVILEPGPWPVGPALGASGSDVVESIYPLATAPRGSTLRLAAISCPSEAAAPCLDHLGSSDALLTLDGTGGGAAILLDIRAPIEIPTLGPASLLLLTGLLLVAALRLMKRPRGPSSRLFLASLFLLAIAGVVWAAISLDGDPSDWTDGDLVATDFEADALGADLVALFARLEGENLFLRFDAFFGSPPIAVDDPDYETDEDTLLTVDAATGVLANDTDPEGQPLTAQLTTDVPIGTLALATDGSFTYEPPPMFNGTVAFEYVATDGLSNSNVATATVTVGPQNDPPVLDPIGIQVSDEQTLLAFTATATDPENDGLTFSLAGAVPVGAAITPGGAFTWTPTEAQGPGTFTFDVVVTDDGTPTLTDTETITVDVNEVNDPPVLAPVGGQAIEEQSLLAFTATAADPEAGGLTFSLAGAVPAGAAITPGGAFTWTPTEAQGPGTFTFDVVVTDDGAPVLTDTETLTVNVSERNDPPVLDPIGNRVSDEQTLLAFTATATDPENGGLTFSLAGAVPAGAAITPGGAFTWTPTEAQGPGTFTFDVVVMDDGTPVLTDTETITVDVNESNDPPTLDPIGGQAIEEQSLLAFNATATDPENDGLTFSLAGAVPAGAAITPGGAFTWTPTEAQGPGIFTFDVVVTDDGTPARTDAETVTVNVGERNDPPALDPVGNRTTGELALLSFTVTATDPENDGLTFSLAGAVPAGAAITPGGAFTWTPTEAQGPGTFTFDIAVADSGAPALTDSETIMIDVSEVNQNPADGDEAGETAIGNVELVAAGGTAAASGSPNTTTATNLLTNAVDPDLPAQALSVVAATGMTAQGGAFETFADGTFTYEPPLGFEGADSFGYSVTDGAGGTDASTVNLTVGEVVWFIDNTATAGGDGRSTGPFDSLADFSAVQGGGGATDPAPGDIIFVFEGDGTDSGLDTGITLLADQELVGQGVELRVSGTSLVTAAGHPQLSHAAGAGIRIANVDGTGVHGVAATGSTLGLEIDFDAGSPGVFSTVAVSQSFFTGTTQGPGVAARSSGTANLALSFDDNEVVSGDDDAGGDAFPGGDFSGAGFTDGGGTLTITSFSGNSVGTTAAAVEAGLIFDQVIFDGDLANGTVATAGVRDPVAGGTLTVGDPGTTRARSAGLVMAAVRGDLGFTSIDGFNQGGLAVAIDNSALAPGDLVITAGGGVLDTLNGPALSLDTLTADLTLAGVSTSGTFGGQAVRVRELAGTGASLGLDLQGGSLGGAAGTTFEVTGGTANITYSGDMTNSAGLLLSVQDTVAGQVLLDGASVQDSGNGADTGLGVSIGNVAGDVLLTATSTTLHRPDGAAIQIFGAVTGTVQISNTQVIDPMGSGVRVDGEAGGADQITGTLDFDNLDINSAIASPPIVFVSGLNTGGSVDFDSASTLSHSAGNGGGIQAFSNAAGAIRFRGPVTVSTGVNDGVNLFNNGVATVSFLNTLDIDTTTGRGFFASNGGVLEIPASAAAVSLQVGAAAHAVDLDGVTLGAGNVVFDSIDAVGTTSDAIDIDNVSGSGFFDGGDVSISDTFIIAGGIAIEASPAEFRFSSATLHNTGSTAVRLVGSNGPVRFTTIDISASNAGGFQVQDNTQSVSILGGSIGIPGSSVNDAVEILRGDGDIVVDAAIRQTGTSRSVDVSNRTGGEVRFGGQITDEAGGISLQANGAGTVTFRGGLALDTGNQTAFTAATSGTVNVCATADCAGGAAVVNRVGQSVSPLSAVGVRMTDVTIGALGVTFQSVDVSGATSGIVLTNTGGTGAFAVTGDGSTGTRGGNQSGGTITATSDAGVLLNRVQDITLQNMVISNSSTDGIRGFEVTDLKVLSSDVHDNGNAVTENGIDVRGLFGTDSRITDSFVRRSSEFNVSVLNTTATNAPPGVADLLTVANSGFGDNEFSGVGADGIFYGATTSANMALAVSGSTFEDCRSDAIQVDAANSSSMRLDLTTSLFNSNNIGLNISSSQEATMRFDVSGNSGANGFTNHTATLINVAHGVGNGDVQGVIRNNRLDGSTTGNGVRIVMEGQNTTGPHGRVLIEGNTIQNWSNPFGIQGSARVGTAELDLILRGNVVDMPAGFADDAIRVQSGNGTAGESNRVCLNVLDTVAPIGDNNTAVGAAFSEGIELQQRPNTVFQLEGLAASDCGGSPCVGTSDTDVEEFLSDNNNATANIRTSGRVVNFTSAACAAPSL